MPVIGLVLIVAAWLVQLSLVLKDKKRVHPWFLALYITGVAFLVIDGYVNGLMMIATLNLISITLSGYIFMRLLHKQRKGGRA